MPRILGIQQLISSTLDLPGVIFYIYISYTPTVATNGGAYYGLFDRSTNWDSYDDLFDEALKPGLDKGKGMKVPYIYSLHTELDCARGKEPNVGTLTTTLPTPTLRLDIQKAAQNLDPRKVGIAISGQEASAEASTIAKKMVGDNGEP
ncbi:hypothetical protein ACLMJK_009227 [Lecanora helva]